MTKRIFTRGDVEVQNIKIGDIHYEYEYNLCIKVKVMTLPVKDQDGTWKWKSKHFNSDKIINYSVSEDHPYYGPNLYSSEVYKGAKFI